MTAILLNNSDTLHVFCLLFSPPLFKKTKHKQHLRAAISNWELEFWTSTMSNRSDSALTKSLAAWQDKTDFSCKPLVLGRGRWFRAPSLPALMCGQSEACCPSPGAQVREKFSHRTLCLGATHCELLLFHDIHFIEKGNLYKYPSLTNSVYNLGE